MKDNIFFSAAANVGLAILTAVLCQSSVKPVMCASCCVMRTEHPKRRQLSGKTMSQKRTYPSGAEKRKRKKEEEEKKRQDKGMFACHGMLIKEICVAVDNIG